MPIRNLESSTRFPLLAVTGDAHFAEKLQHRLAGMGYPIIEIARTVHEAREVAKKRRPALVLIDIKLVGSPEARESAGRFYQQGIPVSYLTDQDGEAAFKEQELRVTIEMALHHSERELHPGEEPFRTFVEHSADGLFLADEGGRGLEANPAGCALLGYTRDELRTLSFLDVLAPAQEARVAREIAQLRDGTRDGKTLCSEWLCRRKDGTVFPGEIHAQTLPDGRFLGVLRDITTRKQAEQTVMDSEERYRTFLHLTGEGISRYEGDLPIPVDLPEEEQINLLLERAWLAECNDAMARMYGFESAKDMIGLRLRDLLPSDQPDNIAHLRRFVRNGYRLTEDLSVEKDRDGSERFFLNTVLGIVENGQLVRTWGTQTDITERRRAEDALRQSETFLRQSERFLRLSQEAGRCGSFEWNAISRQMKWSDEMCRIHGLAPDEFAQWSDDLFCLVHPEDRPHLMEYIQTLHGTQRARSFDYRIIRQDGKERRLYISGEAVFNAAGQLQHIIGTAVDVTEYREAEETLRRILEATRTDIGQDFLRSLANQLTQVCQVEYAMVCRVDASDPERAHTIAVSHGGQLVENFVYALQHTPCANVVGKKLCLYSTGVQQTFPEDRLLVDMGIDAYLGVPLFSREGKPLGLLVLLHDRPLPQSEQAQTILQVVAARAGVEMEREIAEKALRESNQFNQQIIASTEAGIVVMDMDLRYRLWNPKMEEMSGLKAAEVLGKDPLELFPFLREAGVYDLIQRARAGETLLSQDFPFDVPSSGRKGWSAQTLNPLRDSENRIIGVLASIMDVTERHNHQDRLQTQFERLAALRAIDLSILGNADLSVTLGLILDHTLALLGVDAAAILLIDGEASLPRVAVVRGLAREPSIVRTAVPENEPAETAMRERRRISRRDLPDSGDTFWQTLLSFGEAWKEYFAVPLIADNQVYGVLEIYHRTPLQAAPDWEEFLETLAGQAAIATHQATIAARNTALVAELEQANRDMVISHDATIEGWSRALDLRDKETVGHSERVMAMTVRLARSMGIEGDALLQIRRGALLHDVGKLGIPDNILLKPGPLTDSEWEVMRQHPSYAYHMLRPITFLRPALDIPYWHHEKWDGTGYPDGLKGEEIPLAARIFALADIYDALCSDRPYRTGWPIERVRKHIHSLAGTHLDPAVVEAFLALPSPDPD